LPTIRQIKAARALLGWSQSDLARRSGVSEPTIARLESVDGQLGGREETVRKIRTALENSGIEFTDEKECGYESDTRKNARWLSSRESTWAGRGYHRQAMGPRSTSAGLFSQAAAPHIGSDERATIERARLLQP